MNVAFNFVALLVATGLARTGLTTTSPTTIQNVTASIDDIIARVGVLSLRQPRSQAAVILGV